LISGPQGIAVGEDGVIYVAGANVVKLVPDFQGYVRSEVCPALDLNAWDIALDLYGNIILNERGFAIIRVNPLTCEKTLEVSEGLLTGPIAVDIVRVPEPQLVSLHAVSLIVVAAVARGRRLLTPIRQ
jgi:hypothetical protein